MPSIAKLNPFTVKPSAHETAKRVVKGLRIPAYIHNDARRKLITGALRRRRVGILDEQALIARKAKDERGQENFFVEEFASSRCAGFQCVARKQPDDFVVMVTRPSSSSNREVAANSYRITLRHIPPHQVVDARHAVKTVMKNGFLNYFAPGEEQHLGSHVRHGLLPGLMLLQGHYAAAFETLCRAPRLLLRSNKEDGIVTAVGGSGSGGDAIQVLHTPENEIERQSRLARALQERRPVELNDVLCRSTLESVVGFEGCTNLVKEVSALVWNECLTRRVRRHGSRAVVDGDFFVVGNSGDETKLHLFDNDRNTVSPPTLHSVVAPTLGYATLVPPSSSSSSWRDSLIHSLVFRGCALREDEIHRINDHSNDKENESLLQPRLVTSLFDAATLNLQSSLWNVPGEYRRLIEYPRNLQWSLEPDVELSQRELGFFVLGDTNHNLLHKLSLNFSLPLGVSPWMLIRELCKRQRFVIDEQMHVARSKRAETVKRTEADEAAERYRIYRRVKIENKWRATGLPDGLQTAKLWKSIFQHNGMRMSLAPHHRKFNDVRD